MTTLRKVGPDLDYSPHALWNVADASVPADVEEFGKRHGIPELTTEVYRAGFMAGWRAREKLRACALRQPGQTVIDVIGSQSN